jgi:hypothetical protein
LEQAYRYLLDAPTIVKQTAPMAWTYLNGPQDGTVFLGWISRGQGEQRFPSDGYVWCDPEQTYRQEFNGYTVEMMMHSVGFRPNFDQYASHSRTRYHFIAKAPNVNAAPPDPSLWIVHYHQTEQSRIMDIRQLPVPQQMRMVMQERKWLESQGRLERKEFMLHDREHWPVINVPGSMQQMPQQSMYQQQMMQQQMQRGYPSFPMQQPPAKRARHSGPGTMPGSADGAADTSLEDEENVSIGDFFDHLTPREISAARFMQHHRWMEEIFSSPYASNRIVPPDLGLGLMGELKGLTEGILTPPSVDELAKEPERPNKAKEAQPFTNLKKEQLDEFSRRVEKHLEDGHAEIERMKKEHAEKMAEWKKTKTVMQAEKRLRHATWEGHEDAVPVYRLEASTANGDGEPTETVEDVVRDVENVLGVKIEAQKEATLIEKGGLEEKEEQQPITGNDLTANGMGVDDQEMSGMQQDPMMSGGNSGLAPSQLDYGQQMPTMSETKAEALQPSIPQNIPQPDYQADQSQQTPQDLATTPGSGLLAGGDTGDDMGHMNMDDTSLMDDMDMDVDTGDIDFIEHTPQTAEEENIPTGLSGGATEPTPAAVATPTAVEPATSTAQPADIAAEATGISQTASPVTLGGTGEEIPTTEEAPEQPPTVPDVNEDTPTLPVPTEAAFEAAEAADSTIPPADPSVSTLEQPPAPTPMESTTENVDNTAGIFDDGTFDDLANMDDGADDDGLLDFDGGMGMGGDDSAFGEAMHGMGSGQTPGTGAGGEGEGEGGL